MTRAKSKPKSSPRLGRRSFLKLSGAAIAATQFPHVWIPNQAAAQACIGAAGTYKHLLFIRLNGGFRFPVAFNANVSGAYNPFGSASGVPSGVDWGVGQLLTRAGFLNDALREAGMQPVHQSADRITVMPTVDHEPTAPSADGNHTTGLERYLTGYVNGEAGFYTRIYKGLATCYEQDPLKLPPFVLGTSGMARGIGPWAPFRPPVLSGATFDRFTGSAFDPDNPPWWTEMLERADQRMLEKQHPQARGVVDTYVQTRAAVQQYAAIFGSEALKVQNNGTTPIDGISNQELAAIFGNSSESTNVRLALRLFGFGCPAVYFDQGGYDYHSGEENALPNAMERLNRLLSGLLAVLPRMQHPDGGTYWDHTIVVLGSEFSRTARGQRFNSANGSDHTGDYSTRFMSMPFFGGPIAGGRVVGATTRASDLAPEGTRYSYRSVLNTLMDGLGCDPSVFFPASPGVPELFS